MDWGATFVDVVDGVVFLRADVVVDDKGGAHVHGAVCANVDVSVDVFDSVNASGYSLSHWVVSSMHMPPVDLHAVWSDVIAPVALPSSS